MASLKISVHTQEGKSEWIRKNKLRSKIKAGGQEGQKLFWQSLFKKKVTSKLISILSDSSGTYFEAEDKNKITEDFFKVKFSAKYVKQKVNIPEEPIPSTKPDRGLTDEDNLKMAEDFTMKELLEAIARLKEEKAPGQDKITPQVLKEMGREAREFLLNMYNNIWRSGVIPDSWNVGDVVLLLKCAPASNIKQYRPITLISCISKLMTRMIAARLSVIEESSNLINETQFGFRKGRGCMDNIFILNTVLERRVNEGKYTYLLFLDLQEAYDKVNRSILMKRIEQLNFPEEFLKFLPILLFRR